MKKFTLLIAMMAFVGFSNYALSQTITGPSVCDGSTLSIAVTGGTSGTTYGLYHNNGAYTKVDEAYATSFTFSGQTSVGTYEVWSFQGYPPAPNNPTSGTLKATFYIWELPDAPTASNLSVTYDGVSHTASALVGTGESINWYDAETGGNLIANISTVLTQTNVGTYSAWAEAETDATNCISNSKTKVTLTISKADLSVTAVADDIIYGNTPTVTVQYSGFVNGEDASVLDNTGFTLGTDYAQGGNIGNYNTTITAGTAADNNYNYIFNASTFAVTKRDITVTADNKSKVFGASDPPLTYQITTGSLYTGDVFTGAIVRETGELPGDYAILQNTLAISDDNSGNNYNMTYNPGTFTIQDVTDPTMDEVSPARGAILLDADDTFILTVDASDDNLYELEIDHSLETSLPEFSVYAGETDPYGGDVDDFITAGVTVNYDATNQVWTINFGENISNAFVSNGGITFYMVLKDLGGNTWGSMDPTTPQNTFAYTITRDSSIPVFEGASPDEGLVVLAAGENFIWTVDASDNDLYELEVDHNMAALPEFSVYASETDPYGGESVTFATAGVTVTYDATDQVWTIDFGQNVTDAFVSNGGVTFYIVIKDAAGNAWGSMSPTSPENTFVYEVNRDADDPIMEEVTPAEGAIVMAWDENFILTVDASDANLYELEIDHSLEGNPNLPEFSVYANEIDPYGGDGALFSAAGVTVSYDATDQVWVIDFGATVTEAFINNGGITFYLVLKDLAGNTWGSMSPTTPANTYAYTLEKVYIKNIDKSKYYTTISAAIADADNSQTIEVGDGTFIENITIDVEELTLQNSSSPIIDGGGSGVVVSITANNVTFKGFTVQNSGSTPITDGGIMLSGVTGCTIEGNTISDNPGFGLALQLSDGNTIKSNIVNNNSIAGIALMGSKNNTIISNEVKSNNALGGNYGYGIIVDNIETTSPPTFSTGNTLGMAAAGNSNTFSDNAADGVYFGWGCDNNQVLNNTIENNGNDGVYLWKSGSNTITGNALNNNAAEGIQLMASPNNTISENTITGSPKGILIRNGWTQYQPHTSGNQALSTGNLISNNTISGNTLGMLHEDNPGSTEVPYPYDDDLVIAAENNWWGDATGPYHATFNTCGTGNKVEGNVDFSPWLNDVHGTGSPVYAPVVNSTQGTFYCKIQEAINASADGDVIEVAAGVYNEQIIIGRPLSLFGAQKDIDPRDGRAGDESIIDGDNLTVTQGGLVRISGINSGNVYLNGFTFKNSPLTGNNRFTVYATGCAEDVSINLTYNQFDGWGSTTNDDWGFYSQNNLADVIFSYNQLDNYRNNSVIFEKHLGKSEVSYNEINSYSGTPIFSMSYKTGSNNNDVVKKQYIHHNELNTNGSSGIVFASAFGASGYNERTNGKYHDVDIMNNIITGPAYTRTAIQLEIDGDDGGFVKPIISGNVVSPYSDPQYVTNVRGIRLLGPVTDAEIKDNEITDMTNGIVQMGSWGQVYYATGTEISGNKISGSTNGIYIAGGTTSANKNSLAGNTFGILNESDGAINATCNWFGSDQYTNIFPKVTGPIVYVPYLLSSDLNGACGGGPAIPDNLTVTYTASSENIVVAFDVTANELELQAVPGLNPSDPNYLTLVAARYQALAAATTPEAIQAAALAIGDDIITEYYYMDGTTKVYLETAGSNPLVKSKYWDKYLVGPTPNNDRFPDWTNGVTLLPQDTYHTSTNPGTGSVSAGWLNPVLGRDLTVNVTFLNNGYVNTLDKTLAIPRGPVNVFSASPTPANWVSSHTTIQEGIDAAEAGDVIIVDAGTYPENVNVTKQLTIQGSTLGAKPIVNGTGEAQVFLISAPNVTVENIEIQLDQSTVMNGIKTGNSGTFNNLTVKNCNIYGTASTGTSVWNSFGILAGSFGGVLNDQVTITGNVIGHTGTSALSRAVRLSNYYGVITGNQLTGFYSIQAGDNGGGTILIDDNQLYGSTEINNLTASGTFSNNDLFPGNAYGAGTDATQLELKNISNPLGSLLIQQNTFNNYLNYGIFAGRVNNVTIDDNVFTPDATSTAYRSVCLNTKQRTKATQNAFTSGITLTKNEFKGNAAIGQTGIAFEVANYDNVSSIETVVVGTGGNVNTFHGDNAQFIVLNNETGVAPTTGFWDGIYASSMAKVTASFDASNNLFETSPPTLPADMDLTQLFALEDKIQHKIDDAGLGFVTVVANNDYVTMNSFVTPATTSASIQRGIDAASAGWTVNVNDGTYNESPDVDKSLTLLGANNGVAANDPADPTLLNPARGAESLLNGTFYLKVAEITIDGFAITGTGFAIQANVDGVSDIELKNNYMYSNTGDRTIEYWRSAPAANWTLTNNRITDVQADNATAITLFNITTLNISNNTILHTNASFEGRRGMNIDGGQTVNISNNYFDMGLINPVQTPPSYPNFYAARYPLQISQSHRPSTDVTIDNNDFRGAYDGIITLGNNDVTGLTIEYNDISSSIYGIRLRAGTNSAGNLQSDVDILNNLFTNVSRRSIMLGDDASDAYNDIVITNNYLDEGGEHLVYVQDDISLVNPVNAECNYWGTIDGDEIELLVHGDVDYDPWLLDGANEATGRGFYQSSPSCDGTPVVIVTSVPTHEICGTLGSIEVTFSGGVTPFDITWTGGGAASGITSPYTIASLAAGSYDITVTDNNGSSATELGVTVDYLPVTNTTKSTYHSTIQAAIDASTAGDVIEVCAGMYTENLDVDKRLTINGAGKGSDPATNTIISSAAASTPVVSITASGLDATNRLVLNNLRVTGATGASNAGSGMLIADATAQNNLTISNVAAVSNGGPGIGFNNTAGITDVIISTCSILSNGNSGIRISSGVPSFDGLQITGSDISNNQLGGFIYNPSVTTGNNASNFTISTTTFTNNNLAGSNNSNDVSLNAFDGTLTMTDVTVTCAQPGPSGGHAIVLRGKNGASGAMTLTDVTVSGTVVKGGLTLMGYNDVSSVSFSSVDVKGVTAPWGQLIVDQSGTTDLNIENTSLKTINLWNAGGVNATSANFFDLSGVALNKGVLADNFQIEDQVGHALDASGLGLVTWVANNDYVTINSGSIQRGIDAASNGWTVNVNEGTYTEQISVTTENITVIGVDKATTTIQSPAALATSFSTKKAIVCANGVDNFIFSNFTIDGDGQGNANNAFVGLAFWNAGGDLDQVDVTGVRDNPFSGAQHGISVYAYNDDSGPYSLSINGMDVTNFQKNAFALSGNGLTVDMDAINVTGAGSTSVNGQNGIQIGFGAGGTVDNCTVTGIDYTGTSWSAAGILLYQAATVDITDVDLSGCQTGLYINDSEDVSFNGSTITSPASSGIIIYSTAAKGGTKGGSIECIEAWPFVEQAGKGGGAKATLAVDIYGATIIGANIAGKYGVFNYGSGTSTVTIANSFINNWEIGIVNYDIGGAVFSCTANENDLSGNGLGFYSNTSNTQDATCNWYGDPNTVSGVISGDVNFIPFLTNGTDNELGTSGFQPVPNSCDPLAEYFVNDNDLTDDIYTTAIGDDANLGTADAPFLTIQHAVNVVPDGGTIKVDAGTYQEQVSIGKTLEIVGAGKTLTSVVAPDAGLMTPVTWNNSHPVVYAYGNANTINISELKIDGDDGRSVNWFIGALYYEANGTFNNNHITGIRDAGSFTGVQRGHGFYASQVGGLTMTISVTNNMIDDYQKGGIYIRENGTIATVTGNTITGQGIPQVIASNGICFLYGSSGIIENNIVSNNIWIDSSHPHGDQASGILLYQATATISANILSGNEVALYSYQATGSTYGVNDFTDNKIHVLADAAGDINVGNTYDKYVLNPAQTNVVYGYIQYAVDEAADGNVLNASAHTFAEQVTIFDDKENLTLNGVSKTTSFINGGGTGTVVTVMGDGFTLSGFTIQNSGSAATDADIFLNNATGCAITDNILTSGSNGLVAAYGSGNTISANDINAITAYGIALAGSVGNTIEENTISAIGLDAIVIENANVVGGNVSVGSTGNFVKTNSVSNIGRDGIFIGENCSANAITDANTFDVISSIGIHVWRDGAQQITDNAITNALVGIKLRGAENSTITGNTISSNDIGIEIEQFYLGGNWYPAQNNTIHSNKISDNTSYGIMAAENGDVTVDAADNWWGDETGPLHTTHNNCGGGNEVSDYVDFYQWWADEAMTTRYAYPVPTITCPINVVIERYQDRGTYASGEATGASTCYNPVEITFQDNLTGLIVCNNTGTILRTWTIKDYLGQTMQCTQVITIDDNTAPEVICPDPITQSNDVGLCSAVVSFESTAEDLGYFQGFENADWVIGSDWKSYQSQITRVTSGTNGIDSKSGSAHGEITPPSSGPSGSYTFMNGKESVFGDGFVTRIDVYFNLDDPACAAETYGFDISSAVADQSGNHRRDFIFHTAGYDDEILVAASNNTNGARRNNLAGINHYSLTASGWYTLEWNYRDAGDGSLAVDCNLLDANGDWLWTETRNTTDDNIATSIGGNYYMWFNFVATDLLAIDNTRKYNKVTPVSSNPASASTFDVGTTNVVSSATDACGNTGTCNFDITVEDNELPNAVCQDITVYLDEDGEATIQATDVDDGSADNCAIDTYEVDLAYFDCDDLEDNTVTLTITDIHENENTCTATVTVVDDVFPTVECPGNITVCATETSGDTYLIPDNSFDYSNPLDNCTVTGDIEWTMTGATVDNGISTLNGETLNQGTTTIEWKVYDQSYNEGTCTFDVTVNPLPDPIITGFGTVIEGSTEVYSTPEVVGHSYEWVVSGGTKVVSPAQPWICEVTWGTGSSGTVDVTETIDATQCSSFNEITVTITPIALQGTVTYKNNSNTPMNNVTVRLKDHSDAVLGTAITDIAGRYAFAEVPAEVTKIELETAKDWSGGNSTDALAIQRKTIGTPFGWWDPELFLNNVADVNNSGIVNSTDALKVKLRTVYLITSFDAGDWAFWDGATNFVNSTANKASIALNYTTPTTLNIKAMCYGDVNGSYQPSSTKSVFAVSSNSVSNVNKNRFKIPVQLVGDQAIGAATIHLWYDARMVDIKELVSPIPDLIYTIEEGWIHIAWSSLEPLSLPADGTMFTLVGRAHQEIYSYNEIFMLGNETQFADMQCNILSNVYLNINRMNTFKTGIEDALPDYTINCFPNPVHHSLSIAYSLPESGQVEITIVNSLGETIAKIADNTQDAGSYLLKFDPISYGLNNGVYYCRMQVNGQSSDFSKVVRIVYMK